jgi:hypothetical protein
VGVALDWGRPLLQQESQGEKMLTSILIGAKRIAKTELDELQYLGRRLQYRPSRALTSENDRAIVEQLRAAGSHLTTLDALSLPETPDMLKAADDLYALMTDRAPRKGGFIASATQEEIMRFPALLRWGLNEHLLAIVENYICRPIDYRGVAVRRDIKGGEQIETRLWHRDQEDLRIVKIIVYLNDVDRGGGGYEYVDRGKVATWRLGRDTGRINDETMNQLVPPSLQHTCSGPRGTVVFTDTCSVFHRGSIAHSEDRRALFFCYNSTSPRGAINCAPLFDRDAFARDAEDLSSAQLAAIGH